MNQLQQHIDEGRLIRNAWTGTDAEARSATPGSAGSEWEVGDG